MDRTELLEMAFELSQLKEKYDRLKVAIEVMCEREGQDFEELVKSPIDALSTYEPPALSDARVIQHSSYRTTYSVVADEIYNVLIFSNRFLQKSEIASRLPKQPDISDNTLLRTLNRLLEKGTIVRAQYRNSTKLVYYGLVEWVTWDIDRVSYTFVNEQFRPEGEIPRIDPDYRIKWMIAGVHGTEEVSGMN